MAAVPICIYPSGYTLTAPELARYGATHRYTTMASMEAGEDVDWVSATDNPLVEILGGDGGNNWSGSPDTTAITFTGWTTNETYYFTITPLGTARSSDGLWDTTAYILSATNTTIFIDNTSAFYGHFEGLQIQNTGATGNTFYCYDTIGIVDLKNSYIDINGGANGIRHNTVGAGAGNGIVRVWNTIITDGTAEHLITNDDTTYFYHCLVNGEGTGTFGVRGYGNLTYAYNTVVFNVSGSFDFNQCEVVDYCASDAANGTNPIDLDDNTSGEWTAAWTDYTTHDYTIPDTDSILYDAGTDLSNAFTDLTGDTDPLALDIIGNDRSGTWDVGPFVLAVGGATHNPSESIDGVTNTTDSSIGITRNPAEAINGVTDTTDSQLGVVRNPAEVINGITNTTDSTITIGAVINPAEAINGISATTDSSIGIVRNPTEVINGITNTTDSSIGVVRNPAEAINGITDTPESSLGITRNPSEVINGVTNTTDSTLSMGGVHNPAEAINGVTDTTESSIGVTRNPAEAIAGITDTPNSSLGITRNPAEVINGVTYTADSRITPSAGETINPDAIVAGITNTIESIIYSDIDRPPNPYFLYGRETSSPDNPYTEIGTETSVPDNPYTDIGAGSSEPDNPYT